MNTYIAQINNLLDKIEVRLKTDKSCDDDNSLLSENKSLKEEINALNEKYLELKNTSETIVSELNKSIEVIDKYINKQK